MTDPLRSRAALDPCVIRCGSLRPGDIEHLLSRYCLVSGEVAAGADIPGSYWGAPEAGLKAGSLFWRADTPAHSLLHELSHFVCMDSARRASLDTDAGGNDQEECAVCYLEVLLADCLASFGSSRCLSDMDAWGYSFRQGSARAWFEGDGREARQWLRRAGLIHDDDTPTWQLRTGTPALA